MATSLSHSQTRSLTPDSRYRVDSTVVAAVGMPLEVFVYRTEDGSYNRVASVADVMQLPATRAAAQAQRVGFYRQATVSITWDTQAEAEAFSRTVREKLARLAKEYDVALARFVGTTLEILTSP